MLMFLPTLKDWISCLCHPCHENSVSEGIAFFLVFVKADGIYTANSRRVAGNGLISRHLQLIGPLKGGSWQLSLVKFPGREFKPRMISCSFHCSILCCPLFWFSWNREEHWFSIVLGQWFPTVSTISFHYENFLLFDESSNWCQLLSEIKTRTLKLCNPIYK